MKKEMVLTVALLLLGANVFAAGDLAVTGNATVNGTLGVGTTTPTQKLDVNGKVNATGYCIGTNCTTTTLHVSGGVYGYCVYNTSPESFAGCLPAKSPASCGATCTCPTGYTLVSTGSDINNTYYSCYKN